MTSSRPGFLLFRLPSEGVEGIPELIEPTTFQELGALEVQHV
jgi:hypothetical protein